VDARLPNPIFAEGLQAGSIPDLAGMEVCTEVKHGNSRLDFRLFGAAGVCWVETKSVTLVEGGVARFPDAPTARGRRHLESLQRVRKAGAGALMVFIVQREDAQAFAPLTAVDPDFAEGLRASRSYGVAIRAFTCRVSHTRITLAREVPVHLEVR
jgi:sugar fermentation stimulation protein A